MTDRDKIREQLSAWLDGELSDSEVRRLEKAVELDAGLATELQQLCATRELIRRLPREQAPEDFVDRVIARAERMNLVGGGENQVEQPSPLRWIRIAATAAILLITVGTGIVITFSLFSPQFDEHVASSTTPTVSQPGFDDGDREETDGGAMAFPESGGLGKAGGPSVPEGYCDGRYAWFKNGLDLEAELKNYYSSDIHSIEIYTDNLEIAEKDVVKVLDSNGIQPIKQAVINNLDRARASNNATGDIGLLDNSYQVKPLNRAQVQIVVLVDEDQLAKLDKDLKKVISEQRVAQAPPVEEREITGKVGRKSDSMASAIAKAEPAASSGTVRDSIEKKAGDAADEPAVKRLTKGGHVTKTDADGSTLEAAEDVEGGQTISPKEGEKTSQPAPNAEPALETEKELQPASADKPGAEIAGEKTADESPGDTCIYDAEKLDELSKTEAAAKEKKAEESAGDEKDNTTGIQRKTVVGTTTAPETAPASRGRQEATQAKKTAGTTTRPRKEEPTLTQAGPTAQQAARMQRRSPRLRPVLITLNDSEGLREVIIAKQRAAEKVAASQAENAKVSQQAEAAVSKETERSGGAESRPEESK